MSPGLQRTLAVAGWTVGALALALGGFLVWLLGTESGLHLAYAAARPRLPIELQIERMEGNLWSGLRCEGIHATNEAFLFSAERFEVSWDPWALFGRRVHVRRLVLEGPHLLLAAHPAAPPDTARPTAPPDVELPVAILVDSIRVRRLVVSQAGIRDSFYVDEIALDGLQYRDSLGVQRFNLATPWGDLQFRGSLRTRGEYPIDVSFQWVLRPPDWPKVIGYGNLAGDLRGFLLRQHVTEPVHLYAEAALFDLTKALRYEARARLEPVSLTALRAGAPEVEVGGTLEAEGDLESLVARLSGSAVSKGYGSWDVAAEVGRAGSQIDLRSLVASQRGRRARIEAQGGVALDSAAAPLRLAARWRDLAWPLVGEAAIRAPAGRLAIEGVPASWRLRLESDVADRLGHSERLRVAGRGDTTSFTLEEFAGSLLGGTVEGEGRLAWAPEIRWDLRAGARGVNPGVVAPAWPGEVSFRLATRGAWTDSTWSARLALGELSGVLRGRPIAGDVFFSGRHDTTSIVDATLQYGDAVARASGSVLAPIDLAWSLEVPSLAVVDTSWSGRRAASGTLAGRDTLEVVRATANGESLVLPAGSIDAVALAAELDRKDGGQVAARLASRGIRLGTTPPFDSLTAEITGGPSEYLVAGSLYGAERQLTLAARAERADSLWSGAIEALSLVRPEGPGWSLEAPAAFTASPSRASLGSFAWKSGEASLALAGDWSRAEGMRAQAEVREFRLDDLNPFLPPEWRVEGFLSAIVDLTARPDGVLLGEARLEPASGKLVWKSGREVEIAYEDARFEVRSDESWLTLDSGVRLPDLGHASFRMEAPSFRWNHLDSTQAIAGALEAELSKWELLEELSPDVENLRGTVTADVQFAGTLASQGLSGRARLEGGSADVPAVGLEIRDARFEATGETGNRWAMKGEARSDSGRVTVEATADLSEAQHPRATLRIQGERFELVDHLDSRVLISPDLEAKLDGSRLDLTGEIAVPMARIQVGDRKMALAVPPSQDVIVRRAAADTVAAPLDLYTRVRLTLGEDVYFSGYGVTAEPEGSLLVIQEPDKPALGQGELSVEKGTYTGYGRELVIERGRALFAGGPVDDPEVDIRASREIERDDVIAGFEITGTLKKSNLTVFSDPEMSQSEAISYILFGRPIAEAKNSESAIARETAAAMTLQAGSAYTQKVASRFGLDEASLESEGTLQEASLMLGTYLTPSLYARYGVGLFQTGNTFELQYFLNRKWTVEAKTAEENTAGIIYSIEP